MAAHAGGPLEICGGQPVKYPGTGTVTLNYDGGGALGARTKAQADAIVTNAVSVWSNVGTSTVVLQRGSDLPVDVTVFNYTSYLNSFVDGLNPVIYDSDGSIVDDMLGVGARNSVLGFAGSAYSGGTCQFMEGRAVINGFIGVSDATMGIVMAHEVGHLIGLDHTQLDNVQGLSTANYPLMYPIAYRSTVSLHDDDAAAVTALYPDANVNSVYGQVSGNLRQADGVTPVRGANIWAREVSTGKVYSVVSDYLIQGTGYFKLLLPAGTYTLSVQAIRSDFDGGSSVGPYSEAYPTSVSFQPPLYSGGVAMAPVTLGGGSPVQFPIVAGCAATATFNLNGSGSVTGNCGAPPPSKVNSNVVVGSSANPTTYGQTVTFTATVSGTAGVPTGTVDFRDGVTGIAGCTGLGLSGGAATCSIATLAVASHSISAAYSGNTAYNPSTSATLTQTVQGVNASVSLASSRNPAPVGQLVTLTATVTGAAGTPAGTVSFFDGGAFIAGCAAVGVVGGTATCSSSSLATGSHAIYASYSGSAIYNSANSGTLTQAISDMPNGAVNVAAASAGAVATASSSYGASYAPAAVNNGDRIGLHPESGGVWVDGTSNSYPDWVQIAFNGSKTIDHVAVYSLQDAYATAPVAPTDTMTFSLYGVTDFTVQGWTGSTWVTLATVAGNNRVKRVVAFPSFTTDRIRINITGSLNGYSRLTEVEAWAGFVSTNVALATAGATASASSSYGAAYGPGAIINGDRAGRNPEAGGVWVDGTAAAWPDWVQVNFSGIKTIDRVVVYSLEDAYATNPVDPSDAMTFSAYGVTAFTVQAWNGSAWITLGTVTGNNLVKRTVTFAPVSTDRIRVNVTNALNGYSRLTEVEAWTANASHNVALSGAGGVASASSIFGASYPASAINNNDHAPANVETGGVWVDGTPSSFPDWVQIAFDGPKLVDRVVVYSLADNYITPTEPTDATTFSLYGVTDFTVQAWNGSSWVTVASVSGNNLVKRTVNFAAVTTDRVRINITSALAGYARLTEVEAWGIDDGDNVAGASAGGVAVASSSYAANYGPAAINNGDRMGLNSENGGVWVDGTASSWPDWVQVNFTGTRSVSRVVVYSLQDAYATNPVEPGDAMTFTQLGVTDFQVQGWNGSAWVTLATVSGNNLVKRAVNFPAYPTNSIRINITNALNGRSRLTEVEAWGW